MTDKNLDNKSNKIEFTLRPMEVFLLALPVLFIPLLYIQGQAYRESLITSLSLSQMRYSVDFYKLLMEGLRTIDFSLQTFVFILTFIGFIYLLLVALCDSDKLKKFASKIRKALQGKLKETSAKCDKRITRVESVLTFLIILFIIFFFYTVAISKAGSKGKVAGQKIISSLEKNYSTFTEKQYFSNNGNLLAQGVELLCSEKWCAIYYKNGNIVEISMSNIVGIQPVK